LNQDEDKTVELMLPMKRICAIVALPIILGGCGVAARIEDRQAYVNARHQYEESAAAYRACLNSNQATPQNCEARRLAMASDERAFVDFSKPASPAAVSVQSGPTNCFSMPLAQGMSQTVCN